MTQMALELDGKEMLERPAPRCPECGAEGLEPCGRWTERESREPNGWPLHRVGSPWVHGKRGQAERAVMLAAAGVEPWASEARRAGDTPQPLEDHPSVGR